MATATARARLDRWRHRARVEARDALELVAIPALAALLPWRWCFALFKRLSRWPWLYRGAVDAAWAQAQALGVATPAQGADWRAARRLVTLVDHADFYLSRTRGPRWMARHLRVEGAWPAGDQAGVMCTFHWGAGMWGLRHAGAAGLRAHALVAPLDGAMFTGRSVLHRYARARTAEVSRALGQPALDVSATLRPAIRALRAGEQVMAAVDVPGDQVSATTTVPLWGRSAQMPRGLLRLACDQGAPVTVYLTGFDRHSGERTLRIVPLPLLSDTDALAQQVFAHLDAAVHADPVAWHFWAEAPRFFVPAPPPPGAPG